METYRPVFGEGCGGVILVLQVTLAGVINLVVLVMKNFKCLSKSGHDHKSPVKKADLGDLGG